MAFDGTDFVVLDDETVYYSGRGEAPVDVWSEQRLRANAYYLTTGRNPVTLTLYHGDSSHELENSDYPGDRPWMSLDYAAGMRVPMYVSRGIEQVKLSLMYRCECPYDKVTYNEPQVGGDTLYQVRLRAPNGQVIGTATGTLARTTSPSLTQDEAVYQLAQITMSVNAYTGVAGYGTLEFRVKTELGDDTGDNVTLTVNNTGMVASANGDFAYPGSPPTSTSPELLVVQDASGERYEIYSMRPNGSAPGILNTYPFIFHKAGLSLGELCDIYWLSYIQVRSIQVDVVYDEATIAPIDLTALGAHKAVRSPEMMAHAIHPTTLYQRPRPIAIGPPGYRPTRLETWPSTYHTRWPVATNAASESFVDDSILLDIDGAGRIEVVLDVIATFYSPQFGGDGESGWLIDGTIYEYDTADTTWGTPTTVANDSLTEVTVKTYRVTQPSNYYFDVQAQRYSYPRFVYSKYITHDAQSTPEDWQYAHREGLLYEEDYPLIQRVVLPITLSSAATGTYRLVVDASYVSNSLAGFDEVATADRLHLTCVGYQVYQYRDV